MIPAALLAGAGAGAAPAFQVEPGGEADGPLTWEWSLEGSAPSLRATLTNRGDAVIAADWTAATLTTSAGEVEGLVAYEQEALVLTRASRMTAAPPGGAAWVYVFRLDGSPALGLDAIPPEGVPVSVSVPVGAWGEPLTHYEARWQVSYDTGALRSQSELSRLRRKRGLLLASGGVALGFGGLMAVAALAPENTGGSGAAWGTAAVSGGLGVVLLGLGARAGAQERALREEMASE